MTSLDEFKKDLKLWRLLLSNGLKQSRPELSLEQLNVLSQQFLKKIIFIRVLETYDLHIDIGLDLNTDLFNNTLFGELCASLADILSYTVTQTNNYDFHTLTQDIIGQVYE